MTPEYLEEQVRTQAFLDSSPICPTPDWATSRIAALPISCRGTDRSGHRTDLIITLHLSKRDAIADPQNIDDLLRLTPSTAAPSGSWPLRRSYSPWVIQRAANALPGLPNLVRHLVGLRSGVIEC